MDLYLEIAGNQIDGARDYQEDAFLTTFVDDENAGPNSTALLAMADGVGGAAAGNIASQMVTNTFNRQFTSRFGNEPIPDILNEALLKSNAALAATIKETPALDGMGCTCVAGVISNGDLYWVSVGDSHLYVIRDGGLLKKNADHSYGAYLDMMEAAGTPLEPDPRLRRNMLISAMSGEEITMIDCPNEPFKLLPGDRVVICSDGLDTLDTETILATSAASANSKECVAALLQAVTDAAKPKQDNTTVIVCDVFERVVAEIAAPPPEPTPEPAPAPTPAPKRDAYAERQLEDDRPAGGSHKAVGMVVGIGVLAVLAGGAWFLFGGAQDPTPAPAPVVAEVPDAELEAEQETPEVETPPPPVTEVQPEPTFRDRLRSGGEGPLMVQVPAGQFMMGQRGSPDPSMRPEHQVAVQTFAMGVYEVTFVDYDRFARATGRALPDSMGLDRNTHPVFGVSWNDALAYTQWLSRETGKTYRLPSESQWEYAASAGTESPYWWGFQLGRDNAHCFNCTPSLNPRVPTSIGRFQPSAFGLYDTVGNVAEWVHDCFHVSYEGAPADGSVWEGGDCSVRVVRGGHFRSPEPTARRRDRYQPERGSPEIGFRVVRIP